MAGRKNGLGRGLDALFPEKKSAVKEPVKKTTAKTENKTVATEKETTGTKEKSNTAEHKKTAMIVKISSVEPNVNQPRKQFDEDALLELSESIKQYGVLQPLLVSDKKDYYEIIAGERRWRAAKLAGLKEVPVIVKDFSEQELVEISLIENIQREDLNPVEEAMAYKRLIDEFHLKQDEIAERVGKSRTAVTNAMRLLKLSEKVQQMLIDEMITAGHARAILAISDKEKQESVAMKVFDEKLSVRETEALVKRMLEPPKTEKKSKFSSAEDAIYESLEEKMKSIMGTRVQIHRKKNDKGKIEIEYYSKDELEISLNPLVRSDSNMSGIFESLGIDSGIIIIILLILTIFLLVRNISMNMRLSRLERKYKTFMKGSDAQSLEKVFVRKFAQIDKLYDAKEEHDHDLLFIKKNLDKMFNKYGVEKYDAFDDVGGKLSFALALLDKENTGLILNAVHSRDNCFLYMKEIVKGESYVMLSQEEVEALRKAVNFGLDNLEQD